MLFGSLAVGAQGAEGAAPVHSPSHVRVNVSRTGRTICTLCTHGRR